MATRGAKPPLRLFFAAAEFAPLAQTGGLGDAVAGLAAALADRGHELHCLLPGHRSLLRHPRCPDLEQEPGTTGGLPDGSQRGHWRVGKLGGVRLHVLDLPALRERDGLYGGADEGRRFIAFCRAVAARAAEIQPDVLVAHDWHAALSLGLLRTLYDTGPQRGIGAVQVVHNNAYQGVYPAEAMGWTGLPPELFRLEGLEFHGSLSLLKGGVAWADRIVAVSPRYAEELQTPGLGAGLEALYRYRRHRLLGIANGIDTGRHDPGRDPALAAAFDAAHPARRAACRKALLEKLDLEEPELGRLLGAVGRLAHQKGWDVIAEAMPRLVERGASLVLVGDGEAELARSLGAAAQRWPHRVRFARGWNDELARQLYAGVDCVLIPSRFEPCGLVQLLAQRYGALPLAHAVGGLCDTIVDGETGLLFRPLEVETLLGCVDRAAALYRERGATALARRLLRTDVSWSAPAQRWEVLLSEVAAEAEARL